MIGWIIVVVLLGLVIIFQRLAHQQAQQKIDEQAYTIVRLRQDLAAHEIQITEELSRRKRLLAASTEALMVVEQDYRISSANKAAKQIFGTFNKDDTFIRWTRHHELQDLVDQVLRGTKTPPLYFTKQDKILVANARTIKDKNTKDIVAVALAVHDVTKLERLSRARRDFITNISHELRTPITSISLLAETLLDGALHDPKLSHELTTKIAVQTDSLSQLAQEVLDLSLIESGRAPLRLDNFNLKEIVQSQVEQMLPQANHKQLDLQVGVPDSLSVLVDKAMINRVIANLLHNAIKFTGAGQVIISANRLNDTPVPEVDLDDGWVLVTIADTGVGILPDDVGRIFERFYIADQSRSGKSTGLGLAIAKHIINAHGGHIWAESDGKSGSAFHFTLPVEN